MSAIYNRKILLHNSKYQKNKIYIKKQYLSIKLSNLITFSTFLLLLLLFLVYFGPFPPQICGKLKKIKLAKIIRNQSTDPFDLENNHFIIYFFPYFLQVGIRENRLLDASFVFENGGNVTASKFNLISTSNSHSSLTKAITYTRLENRTVYQSVRSL